MPEKVRASLFDLVLSISNVVDLLSYEIKEHHARVASAALAIAEEMGLKSEAVNDLVLAALLHDIGIISNEERLKVMAHDRTDVDTHANKGWILLRDFRHFSDVAEIVRYHHTPWSKCELMFDDAQSSGSDSELLLSSNVLHLADYINILIDDPSHEVLGRVDELVATVCNESGSQFIPSAVDAFVSLSKRDTFWLDLVSPHISNKLMISTKNQGIELNGSDLHEFARLMARIIDFRCSFTATHSSSVARVSAALASKLGLPQAECDKIMLAGYLHDIGKLTVPKEILEKDAGLTDSEYNKMRTHVYYTRRVLEHVAGFEDVVVWASQHHERLDGSGYPDGCDATQITLGSRIVAVADVFSALSEARPYRESQSRLEIVTCLNGLVEKMALDSVVVKLIIDNFDEMERHRLDVSDDVAVEYGEFLDALTLPVRGGAELDVTVH